MTDASPVLEVRSLGATFGTGRRETRVLDDVSFSIGRGETVGLVGESGSGKSVTSLAIMGLLDGARASGEVRLDGRNLLGLTGKEWHDIRGHRISMIFQEPMTSLNPVFTIGEQLGEPLLRDRALSRDGRRARIIEALRETGIPRPEAIHDEYPHRLSGGMRQRVMIALAILGRPTLLVADEPTTALDVTVQAQILGLLSRLRRDHAMSMLLVTHDFGVIAQMCDRVVVMYAGRIVENAGVRELFDAPRHPYTRALLASRPQLSERKQELRPIAGSVPRPGELPPGCAFAPRCPLAFERCRVASPPLFEAGGHLSRCWLQAPDAVPEPSDA